MNTSAIFAGFVEMWGKGLLLLAAGFLLIHLLRRSSAPLRHWIWTWLLAALILIPMALAALPRWEIIPSWRETAPSSESMVQPLEPISISHGALDSLPGMEIETSALKFPATPTLLILLWVSGSLILAVRTVMGRVRLIQIRRKSIPVSAEISDAIDLLRCRSGIRRKVTAFRSESVDVPFTWGILNPRIALPTTVDSWTLSEIQMVLLHEFEHIRRLDAIAVFLGRTALILNWLNPLVWIALQRATACREEACDARVLAEGHDSRNYASLLFQHARTVSAPFQRCATAVAETGTLERRVDMILNHRHALSVSNSSRPRRWLFGISILIVSLIIASTGLIQPASADQPTDKQKHLISLHLVKDETDATANEPVVQIRFDGEVVEKAGLKKNLAALPDAERHVVIRSEQSIPFGEVIDILDAVKEVGISTVSFAAQPQTDGGEKSHDETRAEFLDRVKKGWEAPATGKNFPTELKADDSPIAKKLKEIRIPKVEFVDTPFGDAIDFLVQRSREIDNTTSDPKEKGINVVLKNPELREKTITLNLTNASLGEVLRYSAQLASAQITADTSAVIIEQAKTTDSGATVQTFMEAAPVAAKTRTLIIPAIEFRETPLRDALDFLRAKSIQLDAESPPESRGINIVVLEKATHHLETKITLQLNHVPLAEALKYTTALAGLEFGVQGGAVVIDKPAEH